MPTPEYFTALRTTQDMILEYLKNPTMGSTAGHLVMVCGLDASRHGQRVPGVPNSRLLRDALQGLRRHGDIRFEKREWKLA